MVEKNMKNEEKLQENEETKIFNEENNEYNEAEVLEDLEFEEVDEETLKDNQIKQLENSIKDLNGFNKKMSDENRKLSNELETYKERLIRTNAEYENFRKRTVKEKEGLYTDACVDILKNILPVLDNLERAYSVEGSAEDIRKGLEMTIRQFKDSFDRLNIEEISTKGTFNPNIHNAVMHVQDEQYGENEIVEVFQKGYKRGEKVLRYSMVKVAN